MIRLKMKKYNTILLEKLKKYQHQYRASILVSSGKNDKFEYLMGEEISTSNLKLINQAKFIMFFRKGFEKTNSKTS